MLYNKKYLPKQDYSIAYEVHHDPVGHGGMLYAKI